jgi:hypothetical protein
LATIDIEQAQPNCSHYGNIWIQASEKQAQELLAKLAKTGFTGETNGLKAISAILAETQNGNYCRNRDRHLMPLTFPSLWMSQTRHAEAAADVISANFAETQKASFCQFGKKSKLKNWQRRFLP